MAEVVPKEIGREDVRTLVRRGAQLVEVLPREEYERLHISGAVSIPLTMFSRNTADKLQWDKPVIVYSRGCTCDISARAAWRLASLGFTQVFRYTAGKSDWVANGLPVEGSQARASGAGDMADLDVPTCGRAERIAQVRERVRKEGWNTSVVVNEQFVVLGLLRGNDLDQANPQWTAEEAMDRNPQTYRLSDSISDVKAYLESNRNIDSVLVTTTDGKLFGVIKRGDVSDK